MKSITEAGNKKWHIEKNFSLFFLVFALWLFVPFTFKLVWAESIHVAVASNFTGPVKQIAPKFETSTGHKIVLIFGSSGKHYAQILAGAPFDLFLAADSRRPALLEKKRIALKRSRFTYALGRIVLWSPEEGLVDKNGEVLAKRNFRYLAMANPRLAPYGYAAKEVLEKLGLWKSLQPVIVRGENIGQTFHFIQSGNAELGFVALAQIKQPDQLVKGSWWEIPSGHYTPIIQQAVLISDRPSVRRFAEFLKSEESRRIIREFGYSTP